MYRPTRSVRCFGSVPQCMRRWLLKYRYYGESVTTLLTAFDPPLRVVGMFTVKRPPGPTTIRERTSGLTFMVRGAGDIWSVKEAVPDRFYERYGFRFGSGWTVLDIGAGLGEFAMLAARADPANRVYAFEPFAGSFALLEENARQNSLANVVAVCEAVGSATGTLVLDPGRGEPSHVQSRHVSTAVEVPQRVVPSVSLEDLVIRFALESLDLVKLDCEGMEYDILLNSPHWVLERIARIVLEYHDAFTPHTHHDLVRFLERAGYVVEIFPNQVHADLGYLRAARRHGPGATKGQSTPLHVDGRSL